MIRALSAFAAGDLNREGLSKSYLKAFISVPGFTESRRGTAGRLPRSRLAFQVASYRTLTRLSLPS